MTNEVFKNVNYSRCKKAISTLKTYLKNTYIHLEKVENRDHACIEMLKKQVTRNLKNVVEDRFLIFEGLFHKECSKQINVLIFFPQADPEEKQSKMCHANTF